MTNTLQLVLINMLIIRLIFKA